MDTPAMPKLDKKRKNVIVPISIILTILGVAATWFLNDYSGVRSAVPNIVAATQAQSALSDERFLQIHDKLTDLKLGQEAAKMELKASQEQTKVELKTDQQQEKKELKDQISELRAQLVNITNILLERKVTFGPDSMSGNMVR